jgi:hypothetical protein
MRDLEDQILVQRALQADPESFGELHGEWRAYDFQWNAEIPERTFEPNIPDDYTEFKVTDLFPPQAKAGLVGVVASPAGFVFWKRRRRKRAKAIRHE